MRPTTTIGSVNTTRTSFAPAIVVASPTGPALMTRNVGAAGSEDATKRIGIHNARFITWTVYVRTVQWSGRQCGAIKDFGPLRAGKPSHSPLARNGEAESLRS